MIDILSPLKFLLNYDAKRSKSANNKCKNEGCYNTRRTGSAYCQKCSDKWHKNKREFNNLFDRGI